MAGTGVTTFALSEDGGVAQFALTAASEGRSYFARVSAHGMNAEAEVSIHRTSFERYFANLAANWRGWQGELVFTALQIDLTYGAHALRLTSKADGRGHVTIAAELGLPWVDPESSDFTTHIGFPPAEEPGSWVARVMFVIDAGHLDELARRAAALPYECTPDSY